MIAAGGNHSLVIHPDGTVWSFGSDTSGQLGRSANLLAPNPVPAQVENLVVPNNAPGGGVRTAISAGSNHSLMLRGDGSVYSFGSNGYGQLGNNTVSGNPTATPTQVTSLYRVTAIAAGGTHSLALMFDGTVWSFGSNAYGESGTSQYLGTSLGDGVVRAVTGLSGVVAISAGTSHSLALRSDGTVWAFGSNQSGQLGTTANNGTEIPNPVPTLVPGLAGVRAIAAGRYHSLALRSDGTVWSFGQNDSGQLGTSANSGLPEANPIPTQVPGLSGIIAIAAGGSHSLALRSDGTVWGFGSNRFGQLGTTTNNATLEANPVAAQVPGLTGVTSISAGDSHSLAVTSDGSVFAFGLNTSGQLGLLSNTSTTTPNPTATVSTTALTSAPPSRFIGMTPTRVLDTRPASRLNYSGDKPGPLSVTNVTVAGRVGVPLVATAITGNLTVTEATAAGYVQAFPTLSGQSGGTSNVNVERVGQTIANAVTVPIGANGSISLNSQSGTHLVLDITGYFVPATGPTSAGRLVAVTPTRVFDTRVASAVNYTGTTPVAGSVTRVQVTGKGPVPATGVDSVVLNVTATEATAPGYVQVAPAGLLVPGASSNLNIEQAGQTIPNQVIVPVGAGGAIEIYTQRGTELIVDVSGYITDTTVTPATAGLFVPINPTRMLDTRSASLVGYRGSSIPAHGDIVTVDTWNWYGMPSMGVAAVATNATITEASAVGFVQTGATGTLIPGTSSTLNANTAGQTIANAAIIPVIGGQFDLFTQSGGHLLADISGYYTG